MGAQTQHNARPQVGRPNTTEGTAASWAPQRTSATQTQGTSAKKATSASWAPQHKRKARPQVGRPNARPQRKRKVRPHVRKLGAPTQRKARPQDGRPNAKQIRQRKRPHKGALGQKTSWRMDKNKFWLGGRLFNTASPRLGTPTQRKARPQDGRINATQGTSASWAPQRNARHVRKLGAPTHVRNANARHVHNGRHVHTSASWAPQRNARHFRKMVAQTQNSSATKTYTQGSTRLKDELEDG
jgi:hypothetical protein